MNWQTTLACEENASWTTHRCPLLTTGGIQCAHQATIVPQHWELPPYGIPGQAVCFCCYLKLKQHSSYSQSLRTSLW